MCSYERSPYLAQLIQDAPLNELGPGQRNSEICQILASEPFSKLFAPLKPSDNTAARACVAGLFLLYDGLDESHAISQELEDTNGSYWHAIMHRREPDYGNAKYWFARVRQHPIYPGLAGATRELASDRLARQPWPAAAWILNQDQWQPERFVDLCQAAQAAGPAADQLCRQIQRTECELLLDFCYRRAIGD